MRFYSLKNSSQDICVLCQNSDNLIEFQVKPKDEFVLLCDNCISSIDEPTKDENHWRCLDNSMWSEVEAVKVLSYRVLKLLGKTDECDMIYMEEHIKKWADDIPSKDEVCIDTNGNILESGDTVTIIKDLPVKGAGFVAKQGTSVKNIQLVSNDPTHIQGKVNGVKIFILTKYVKK